MRHITKWMFLTYFWFFLRTLSEDAFLVDILMIWLPFVVAFGTPRRHKLSPDKDLT